MSAYIMGSYVILTVLVITGLAVVFSDEDNGTRDTDDRKHGEPENE